MKNKGIKSLAANLSDRVSLLNLLNLIRQDYYGDSANPFTLNQLDVLCDPNNNRLYYKSFSICKRSGGYRYILSPINELKQIQKCISILLQAIYEPSVVVMGFTSGRSVLDNARVHVNANYLINVDLEDFFFSISQTKVLTSLMSTCVQLNQEIASCIAGICCTEIMFHNNTPIWDLQSQNEIEDNELFLTSSNHYRIVLPQGAPSSPVLSNIVSANLDYKLAFLAKDFGFNYSRYADDITFSCTEAIPNDIWNVVFPPFWGRFVGIVNEEHFTIKTKKTRIQKKGGRQVVTGLVVSEKVNVPREYTRSITCLLYIWERYGYTDAVNRFKKHYHSFSKKKCSDHFMERVLYGKLMYLRMIKGEENILWQRLYNKYIFLVKREF